MNYLITGGTGFIGAYITKALVEEGLKVVLFDAYPRKEIFEYLLNNKKMEQIQIIRGDILDLAHLIRVIKENDIKRVIHMAALLSMASQANPSLAVRINCEGTVNVLEAARIMDIEKVVYASSNTVFGTPEKYPQEYIPNDAPHFPSSIYGACKSFIERLAESYFNDYGVDSIGLRFPVVYGFGHKEGAAATLTEELMIKPALGKSGRVPYRGDEILNWLYVEDAARGVLKAANARTKTKAFNIGGEICSVSKAVEYVKNLIPEADITCLPKRIEFTGKFDTTPIKEEIGFAPEWSLEKGIREVIEKARKFKD